MEQGLGMRCSYPVISKRFGTLIPTIKGAWLYDYMGDKVEATGSFTGGGDSFRVEGVTPAQHGFILGAELACLDKGNLSLTINYDWELKDRYQAHTYYGTVRFDF